MWCRKIMVGLAFVVGYVVFAAVVVIVMNYFVQSILDIIGRG